MFSQDILINTMRQSANTKERASIMSILAEDGDENAILPLLQAINMRRTKNGGTSDGDTMFNAAFRLCYRHFDKAKTYLMEIQNQFAQRLEKDPTVAFSHADAASIEASAYLLGFMYDASDFMRELNRRIEKALAKTML